MGKEREDGEPNMKHRWNQYRKSNDELKLSSLVHHITMFINVEYEQINLSKENTYHDRIHMREKILHS